MFIFFTLKTVKQYEDIKFCCQYPCESYSKMLRIVAECESCTQTLLRKIIRDLNDIEGTAQEKFS